MDNDYYGEWENQILIEYFHIVLNKTDFVEENEVEE